MIYIPHHLWPWHQCTYRLSEKVGPSSSPRVPLIRFSTTLYSPVLPQRLQITPLNPTCRGRGKPTPHTACTPLQHYVERRYDSWGLYSIELYLQYLCVTFARTHIYSLFVSSFLSHTPLSTVDLLSVPVRLWFSWSGNLSGKGVMREDLLRIMFLLTTQYDILHVQW